MVHAKSQVLKTVRTLILPKNGDFAKFGYLWNKKSFLHQVFCYWDLLVPIVGYDWTSFWLPTCYTGSKLLHKPLLATFRPVSEPSPRGHVTLHACHAFRQCRILGDSRQYHLSTHTNNMHHKLACKKICPGNITGILYYHAL